MPQNKDDLQNNAAFHTTGLMESRKLCHLVKQPDFDGYGFNLHSEKAKPGQFIGMVDPNSPAEKAGLKQGDRIIEVNGVLIDNETHKQVVQRIKSLSCEVRLLLIDVDGKTEHDQTHSDNHNSENMHTSSNENGNGNGNGNMHNIQTENPEQKDTVLEIPTLSANISSINLHSSQRTSNNQSNTSHSNINDNKLKDTSNNQSGSHLSSKTELNINAIKSSSLQLPTTAAEMRAKLLSKKKYDPKNLPVDLKQKFEIIQKL